MEVSELEYNKARYLRIDEHDETIGKAGERRIFNDKNIQIGNKSIDVYYHKIAKQNGEFEKSISGIQLEVDESQNPYLFLTLGDDKYKIALEKI